MGKINAELLQKELRQSMEDHPFDNWSRVQTDDYDRLTRIIFNIPFWKTLVDALADFDADAREYAIYRWRNFWYSQACEHFFSLHRTVRRHPDRYHKEIDFYISDIPFDLKSTCKSRKFAGTKIVDLITWLYENQSKEGRYHINNRLFIILEHWRLKAELQLTKQAITDYLNNFNSERLYRIEIDGKSVVSDAIFVRMNHGK